VSNADDRETTVRIRRAPKFSVFLVLGAVIGLLVSLILTASFPIDETVGFGPTFGYFAIYGLVGGILLGSIVALIFDRVSSRRAKSVSVTVDYLEPVNEEPEAADPTGAEASGPAPTSAEQPSAEDQ
jgi:hypothetical protein